MQSFPFEEWEILKKKSLNETCVEKNILYCVKPIHSFFFITVSLYSLSYF